MKGTCIFVAVQFPIECSLPWMLVDHVIESQNAGLLESILMPFDIYNDSAQHALMVLKQRFLYDEIESEVIISETELGRCLLWTNMTTNENVCVLSNLQKFHRPSS